jgi:hypothetical protein
MARQIVSTRDFPPKRIAFRDSAPSYGLESRGNVPLAAGDSIATEAQAPEFITVWSGGGALTAGTSVATVREAAAPSDVDSSTSQALDSYSDRLIKYIPAEVVALYLTLDALIRSAPQISIYIYWAVFTFCFFGTYLYLWRIQKVKKQLQLHISGGAFVVWVFAMGGPFAHLGWYDPIYAGILLPMFTFLVALVEP